MNWAGNAEAGTPGNTKRTMIEMICTECGHRLSFPNQYAGTPRSCHFCGAIVSLPEQLPASARANKSAQKSVGIKNRKSGPLGLDSTTFYAGGGLLGFAVLLCITGYLTGQTGSPFSLFLFVLGLVILAIGVGGTVLAIFDVDVLSSWTRLSFTLPTALALFVVAGALGLMTAIFTYSP